eukprot:COSAG03_NODE_1435_length_4080_cov_9.709261_5_plen_167_part_00
MGGPWPAAHSSRSAEDASGDKGAEDADRGGVAAGDPPLESRDVDLSGVAGAALGDCRFRRPSRRSSSCAALALPCATGLDAQHPPGDAGPCRFARLGDIGSAAAASPSATTPPAPADSMSAPSPPSSRLIALSSPPGCTGDIFHGTQIMTQMSQASCKYANCELTH